MFSGRMPNSDTFSALVETATKCLATSDCAVAGLPRVPALRSHWRALVAFVIVSCVVNVLLATMKSVVSGERCFTVVARCVPSILLTKCTLMLLEYGSRASQTIFGPRSLPPMPMLTTSVMALPVYPFHSPERTDLQKAAIRSRTSKTSGCPKPVGWRRATWSTALSSVLLMGSPENILSIHPRRSAASTSFSRSGSVSYTRMFLEKSNSIFTDSCSNCSDSFEKRSGSALKSSRMCTDANALAWCSLSASSACFTASFITSNLV
mmetsp:Transcript_2407/g.8592  ORF Transcript_2407/g.8592 Transcript_2407/m.8592 type:complete len:265 (-) Transcript_2407:14-808(-)